MKFSKLHTGSVVDLLEDDIHKTDYIQSKINCNSRDDKDDAFFVCDLGDVVKKWKRFNQVLPEVEPFYAIKCNPDPVISRLLSDLGANFDCASKTEIKTVLSMGVAPERIIFANPCKQASFIKYACANGVNMMTFDNEPELYKIKQHHPNAELVIRIRVDDSKSLCKFGIKFGVCPTQAKQLLQVAKKLKLNVIGVSFHVGSGCYDASLFYEAVKSAHSVFDQGKDLGYNFTLLDVGGGFPGVDDEKITFEDAARELRYGFDEFFPPSRNIRIIAEPGRFFVASAVTAVCNITSVREVVPDKTTNRSFMYYLNDGVYGSFNCVLFDHQYPVAYALSESHGSERYKCVVWGPTCDAMDCISDSATLPQLNVGEWICFDNMGAYTTAAASRFNGFKQPTIVYMCRRLYWNQTNGDEVAIKKLPQAMETVVLPVVTVH